MDNLYFGSKIIVDVDAILNYLVFLLGNANLSSITDPDIIVRCIILLCFVFQRGFNF